MKSTTCDGGRILRTAEVATLWYAFFTALSLTLLTRPAMAQADDFTYVTNNGNISITGYKGRSGVAIIPYMINGILVTNIGTNAFWNCSSLKSITIPTNVTSIGSGAFFGCMSLTSVDLPNSIRNIERSTFYWTGLTNVTIPEGVNSIARNAFGRCNNLTNITMSSTVTNIEPPSFNDSPFVTFTVAAANEFYACVDGVLYDKSLKTLVRCPEGRTGNFVIPGGVTNLGSGSLYFCKYLNSVTLPNGLTTIQDVAFYGCGTLHTLTIPATTTKIGSSALSFTSSLVSVYFLGAAPVDDALSFDQTPMTVFYLPGTLGWGSTFGGRPTVCWNPQIQTSDTAFGVLTNGFGFTISGNSNIAIMVEATSNPANPSWLPLRTNALTSDSVYFSDPDWRNYPARFYRVRWP